MVEKIMFNRRGQVVIWVVLAILIVASIVLFFTISRDVEITVQEDIDPDGFVGRCAKKYVNEAVDIMLPRGGFVNPENFKLHEGVKVSYLCLNKGFYLPCVNQHPMFLNEMRQEIEDYVSPKIDECLFDLKQEIDKRGGSVTYEDLDVSVDLGPNRIFVYLDRRTTISQKGGSQTFENFEVDIVNPVYDLGNVAIEIASQEAKYCYFEYVGYMILYPKFDIRVFTTSDSTTIYKIKDKSSGKELNIAVRSCAIPPGI